MIKIQLLHHDLMPLQRLQHLHRQRHHSAYTRMLYHRMDCLITTTRAAAAFLDREARVIPLGIDPNTFQPAVNRDEAWRAMGLPGKRGIGIFGRVRPQKGTEEFVDALCQILPKRPDWTGCVIGETTPAFMGFQRLLESRIEKAGLAGRVQFIGKVEDFREIPLWYQAMSVVAVPSKVEGFGLTCLEAMASECGVIATETGVFPDIINAGENGWIVPCNDSSALAKRMAEATAAGCPLEKIGKRARKRVLDGFTIMNTAQLTAEVYDNLIDQQN